MSTGRCSPEPSRECSSMFLTIESARLPCCTIFSRLPCSVSAKSVISARAAVVDFHFRQFLLQFVDQLDRERGEIVDEIERVFDLVGDAGGQLAERSEFFGLHQAVLRGAQFLQRLR